MTLWDLPAKKEATVTAVSADLDINVVDRLNEMGIASGQRVTCVRKGPIGGPVVLQLGGSIFAIEHVLANQISVDIDA